MSFHEEENEEELLAYFEGEEPMETENRKEDETGSDPGN